jgi:hypothetical protein
MKCSACGNDVRDSASFCEHCGRSLNVTGAAVKQPFTRSPVVLTTCLLALAAFGGWPYAFYQLLRLITCGTAGYMAFITHQEQKRGWMWTVVAVALLFNPLLPIRLSRQDWQPIDLVVALVFGVFLLVNKQR